MTHRHLCLRAPLQTRTVDSSIQCVMSIDVCWSMWISLFICVEKGSVSQSNPTLSIYTMGNIKKNKLNYVHLLF